MITFSKALEEVKQGAGIRRIDWNGKGMTVFQFKPGNGTDMTSPYLYITYPDGKTTPWLPSQADMFAEDWVLATSWETEQ